MYRIHPYIYYTYVEGFLATFLVSYHFLAHPCIVSIFILTTIIHVYEHTHSLIRAQYVHMCVWKMQYIYDKMNMFAWFKGESGGGGNGNVVVAAIEITEQQR